MDKYDEEANEYYRHCEYVLLQLPCLVENCQWCKEQEEYANRGTEE